ncbi:MAG: C-terminal binding protein [Syntrophothermus sp.]|uniref:C-terminal binding protein n=1 Tax=Syntrophothermus sp. TaxID=2736299 RepID=UPI00257F612A|nr:C-terminal binding protein [Syntrophothermus sp.]NSW83580.1 C-terminal binding protein [Syntrophothermus sp.]
MNNSFKVVITDYVSEDIMWEKEKLGQINAVLVGPTGNKRDDILEAARDADAIIVCFAEITGEIIGALSKCKIIARTGIGVNNIDVEAATRKGIVVTNVPDYCVEEVSDHTLALLLALVRKIPMLDRHVKQGRWTFSEFRPMPRLRGKVLGLIGFGKISREFARKAMVLGFEIIAYDPYLPPEVFAQYGVKSAGLEEIITTADFISLHVPLTPETRHLLGEKELKAMKRTAYLVNSSRGGLIDEEALYKALKEGWIAGAALDVLEREETEVKTPLLTLDNVIITPHSAYYSEESVAELRSKVVEEVISVLTGKAPRYPVNRL